jgi:protein dithiol oxidoreductase (disulfide-forming)
VTRAKKMVADYKVDSVPTLVVAGRWMTSPSLAGSQERSLQIVDQLAQKAHAAK